MAIANLLLITVSMGMCSTIWLSSQWKCFPYLQSELFISPNAHPLAMHHCEQLVFPLGGLLIGMIRLTRDPPQSLPFPRLKKPVPSASAFRWGSPGLWASRWPSAKPALVYCHLPRYRAGRQNCRILDAVCWVGGDKSFIYRFSYIILQFTKPRMLLAFFTARAHFQLTLALHQDAQALSRDLSPGCKCPTCLIVRGSSFPGAGLSICPCWISQSPSSTVLQLV